MTGPRQTIQSEHDTVVPKWLENTLLCMILALVVLRSTIIEAPLTDPFQLRSVLGSENITLLLSTVLMACMGLWVLATVFAGRIRWRKTGLGVAIAIFIVAGLLSVCFASNKRAAVTDLVMLATPMLTGLVLVQLLTSAARIRLALFAILAVGVTATVQCIDQQASSNETMIAEYEANPTAFLEKQGIETGTMEHWMFEHRMYSEDIRGFLLTSNSSATFFLMAVFAAVGLCLQVWRKHMSTRTAAVGFCYLLALLFVLSGLFLTQSKGGIGAFVLGVLLLAVLLRFGKTIWKRSRIFGYGLLLLLLIAVALVVDYGIRHGRLPGGNSMLVRWQYWVSTAEMVRDHFLTGVGGGNFSEYYTHYKIPAALETVQNPHNWVLSLLSQYGLPGFVAVVAAILIVFVRALTHSLSTDTEPQQASSVFVGRLWVGVVALAAVLLFVLRPALVDTEFLYQKPDVAAAAYLVLYFVPALVFVLAFILLSKAAAQHPADSHSGHVLSVALICGLVSVLIHNLIDFAIFEPGNWGVFWLVTAILIAQIANSEKTCEKTKPWAPPKRLGVFAALLITGIAYLSVVFLPPLRAEALYRRAMLRNAGGFSLMDEAVAADTLSPKVPYRAANFLTQVYQNQGMNDQVFLERARGYADIAIDRNPADFKPLRLRAKINVIRSEQTEDKIKQAALEKAFDDLQQALARYPGSGKLNYLLGNVAEQLGRESVAVCYYQSAVNIEDAYRQQFKLMYPDRNTIISRLGEDSYTDAKAKIQQLQK